MVESIDQIWDGATLKVTVPNRRIFVTFSAMSDVAKEIVWFPGATTQQIETTIRHICGIPLDSEIEFFDMENRAVVLSSTIPNETNLLVKIVSIPMAPVHSPNAPPHPSVINPLQRLQAAGNGVANPSHQALYGSETLIDRPTHQVFHPGYDGQFKNADSSITEVDVTKHSRKMENGSKIYPGIVNNNQNSGNNTMHSLSNTNNGSGTSGGVVTTSNLNGMNNINYGGHNGTSPHGMSIANNLTLPSNNSNHNTTTRLTNALSKGNRRPVSSSASNIINGSSSSSTIAKSSNTMSQQQQQALIEKQLQQECVHMLAGHAGAVTSLEIVGDVLFSGSADATIMIWDLNNLQYIGALPGHKGAIKALAASGTNSSHKLLCSGSTDKTIKLWSLTTFSVEKTLSGHTGEVLSLCILDDRAILASGSSDKSIRLWCLRDLAPLLILENAHASDVFALHPLNNSRGLIVSGSRDRCIKVWDSSNWESTRTLHPPHYDSVTCFASLPNGLKFYSGSRDKSLKEWDLSTLTSSVHGLHLHTDWITAMTYSPHLGLLFTAGKDGTVKGWDAHLVCRCVLVGHQGPVSSLWALNEYLFSGGSDRHVRVWKPSVAINTVQQF